MSGYRFAGFRVVGFPHESRVALREVAERLAPSEGDILARWVDRQFGVWAPPGLERDETRALFGEMLHLMLGCMASGTPESCMGRLRESGARLARSGFPFEALILSLHFLEESYMPFLLNPRPARAQEWLIFVDEFLHVAIGEIATSYFEAHRAALLAEAEVGRVIQEGLAPHIPSVIGELEIGHAYVSATQSARLGGDFIEAFPLDGDRVAFIIGDLAGHGLEAVIDGVTLRSLFRGLMRDEGGLVDVVHRLNRIARRELDADQFATVLAGVYTPPGRVEFVNAGNPHLLHCGERCGPVAHYGFPLAVVDDPEYDRASLTLAPGDLLVAYTDGLVEARRGSEMVGERRVERALAAARDLSPSAVAEDLLDLALSFARGHAADDISILVLRRARQPVG